MMYRIEQIQNTYHNITKFKFNLFPLARPSVIFGSEDRKLSQLDLQPCEYSRKETTCFHEAIRDLLQDASKAGIFIFLVHHGISDSFCYCFKTRPGATHLIRKFDEFDKDVY